MKQNMGSMDRMGRALGGFGLIALALVEPAMSPWGYLGLVPLLSGLTGFCPVYLAVGMETLDSEPEPYV